MRILLWYCDKFAWTAAMKTLGSAADSAPGKYHEAVVAFIHVEPKDVLTGSSAEKKLVKTLYRFLPADALLPVCPDPENIHRVSG